MQEKIEKRLDNYISIGYGKFSVLRREYLSSAVSVLTNSPKISNITKRDISQLNLSRSEEAI